jgi:hypothetical protein
LDGEGITHFRTEESAHFAGADDTIAESLDPKGNLLVDIPSESQAQELPNMQKGAIATRQQSDDLGSAVGPETIGSPGVTSRDARGRHARFRQPERARCPVPATT